MGYIFCHGFVFEEENKKTNDKRKQAVKERNKKEKRKGTGRQINTNNKLLIGFWILSSVSYLLFFC